MVRLLLVALFLHSSAAKAVDLEVAPIGTIVSGSFELGGRLIPLPQGSFQLAARTINEAPSSGGGGMSIPRPKVGHVILFDIRPPRMVAAVHARAALRLESHRFHWWGQPCMKEDTLFRADLTGGQSDNANCLLVDHGFLTLGPKAQGIWKDATSWLTDQKVLVPGPVMISAHVTRFHHSQLVATSYFFNPRMHGCNTPISRSWAESPWNKKHIDADPQRVRFVESVTAWGKVVQTHFDALLTARDSKVENGPVIYNCHAGQLALSGTP